MQVWQGTPAMPADAAADVSSMSPVKRLADVPARARGSARSRPAPMLASTLASPMPRVLWECSVNSVSGKRSPHARVSRATCVGLGMPVVSHSVTACATYHQTPDQADGRQSQSLKMEPEEHTMTSVQISLPDDLAQKAASAGLLSAEAMEAMLREQLRRHAGQALQAMWQRAPQEDLTPEIEQEIVEEVRKVRAERRLRGAS